ncbi:MAG: phosphate acyltransferase PlsX [Holosporales bacterium]|jgi:glycerol-3-phosphate acyltransferase PlsX|nr:phosphate acyltransferase PlsX [Holosporales bacterium]
MKRIALDVMGGDLGIQATVPGMIRYIMKSNGNGIAFDLFGKKSEIDAVLAEYPKVDEKICQIHDTGDNVIQCDQKPAIAVRNGKGTSMFEAIAFVADGHADAVVSSGNTGAYMALSKCLIGSIENIDRPALVGLLPNVSGSTVMLDLGANTDCTSTKLIQFALMGHAVASVLLSLECPRIGLLNIGTERTKGTKPLEEAYEFLESFGDINFSGFVEGTDITSGVVDVVVSDGFSGNISLKTMEGTFKYIMHVLMGGFSSSLAAKFGYIFCKKVFRILKSKIDPRINNGAPLVGLKKVSVKSHGNSDYIGFSNAISVAVNLVNASFIEKVKKSIQQATQKEETWRML